MKNEPEFTVCSIPAENVRVKAAVMNKTISRRQMAELSGSGVCRRQRSRLSLPGTQEIINDIHRKNTHGKV